MAIAFGSANGRTNQTNSTSLLMSTSVVGTDVYGTVGLLHNVSILSVTWDSVPGSLIATTKPSPEQASFRISAYIFNSPVTGSIRAVSSTGVANNLTGHWMYHTGVAGLDAVNPVFQVLGSVTTMTTSIATVTDGAWAIQYSASRDVTGAGIAAGAGATKRGSDTDDNQLFDSGGPVSPAGVVNMTVTQVSKHSMATFMFAYKPVVAVGTVLNTYFPLLGVGP